MASPIAKKKKSKVPPKLVLLGDSGVGKSCFLLRFAKGEFADKMKTTVGVDFSPRTLAQGEGEAGAAPREVQLWDTAGNTKYRAMTSAYYHQAVGALFLFDLTARASFDNLGAWYEEARANGKKLKRLVLVGTKADLAQGARREVSEAEAQRSNRALLDGPASQPLGVVAL